MLKRRHEMAVTVGKGEHLVERGLWEPLKEGMVDGIASFWRLEGPAAGGAMLGDGNGGVVAGGNPPVDRRKLRLQRLFEFSQVVGDRLLEDGPIGFGQVGVLVLLPLGHGNEIISDAAKANALAADQVTRLQGRTNLLVDEELVAVDQQLRAGRGRGIEIALEGRRDAAGRDRFGINLGERTRGQRLPGETARPQGGASGSGVC